MAQWHLQKLYLSPKPILLHVSRESFSILKMMRQAKKTMEYKKKNENKAEPITRCNETSNDEDKFVILYGKHTCC